MAAERSCISLGGKGWSFNSSSVYKVAASVADVAIDSCAIERFFSGRNTPSTKRSSFRIPEGLTSEETRASLVVLLNKLILSTSGSSTVRSVLPLKIVDILNSKVETFELGEIDVTEWENIVLEKSCACLVGICCIIDHKSTALSQIVDLVAALSCEVTKADIASFSWVDSGDGNGDKDAISVAADLKVLLNGFKGGVGGLEIEEISKIPRFHGDFRYAVKKVHLDARREVNSGVKGSANTGLVEALGKTLSALSAAVKDLGECSFFRAKLCFESIENENLRNVLSQVLEKSCLELENLRNSYKLACNAHLEEDYCRFAHQLNESLGIVWRIVGLEAVSAFFALAGGEMFVQKTGDDVEKEDMKKKIKNEKNAVVAMGKGTTLVIKFIKDRLVSNEAASDGGDKIILLKQWVEQLSSLFNPEGHSFDSLLDKVKEIVES